MKTGSYFNHNFTIFRGRFHKLSLKKKVARMLDFFSIFSKGGILLWCFKGAGLLPKEWEAFTPTVNELIKSVLLQERAVKKNYWECGQLALKYRMVRGQILNKFWYLLNSTIGQWVRACICDSVSKNVTTSIPGQTSGWDTTEVIIKRRLSSSHF